jgi:hypothetical protein
MIGAARTVTFLSEGEGELAFVRVLRDMADWIERNPLSYGESIFLINVVPLRDGAGARAELVIRVYGAEGTER